MGLGIAIAAGVAAVVGVFASREEEAPEPAPVAVTPSPSKPTVHFADPPPPPPPEPEPEPAPAPKSRPPKSEAKRPSACDGECAGSATPELQSALRARAGQARGCYERALSHNSSLQGNVQVDVRIGPTGEVCSAVLGKNTLGEPAVTSCVLQRFRGSRFPKPSGGCVDAAVPINFVPRQP